MPEDEKKDQNQNPDTNTEMDAVDPNFEVPSLDKVEYATPSAYIDPDLPDNPDPIEDPNEPEETPEEESEALMTTAEQIAEAIKASNETMITVAEKIANARNIVVALSSDPSVDELSSAIALSLFLERLQKHAITVYSGAIPSALEFLKPEDVFEKNADVMQDFVISMNKDKADYLRYKLDGDAVKIFITPYRERIASGDLGFSYGDYNIDLVLSLNVNNAVDLDPALQEYGTSIHGGNVVNIVAGNPGKFGELEWSNKYASSVSEMISNLLLGAEGDIKIDAEEATALLTGIVAATDRFSRANTTSNTMQTASKLMEAGADQQLIAANISDELDNRFFSFADSSAKKDAKIDSAAVADIDDVSISFEPTKEAEDKSEAEGEILNDGTTLEIPHGENESIKELEDSDSDSDSETEKTEESPLESNEPASTSEPAKPDEPAKPAEPAPAEPATPAVPTEQPAEPEKAEDPALLDELKATEASLSGVDGTVASTPVDTPAETPAEAPIATPEIPTTPTTPTESFSDATSKYSQMLTDALKEPGPAADNNMGTVLPPVANPAAASAPEVSTPEVTGVPEINYGQTTSDILPPPPAPPVDINSPMPVPAPADMPPTTATTPAEPAPSSTPDASAFTIPGM